MASLLPFAGGGGMRKSNSHPRDQVPGFCAGRNLIKCGFDTVFLPYSKQAGEGLRKHCRCAGQLLAKLSPVGMSCLPRRAWLECA